MNSTKEQILILGESLIRTNGFNAFSYKDISGTLGIKNAAVHYYFPTKIDLGEAILENVLIRYKKALNNEEVNKLNYLEKFNLFLKLYLEKYPQDQLCIVGAAGTDFKTFPLSMQKQLQEIVEEILNWVTSLLKEGREAGFFKFDSEPSTKALMIMTNLAAGLVLSRISGDEKLIKIKNEIMRELGILRS